MRKNVFLRAFTVCLIMVLASSIVPLNSYAKPASSAVSIVEKSNRIEATNGNYSITYDLLTGKGNLSWKGQTVMKEFSSNYKLKGTDNRVQSTDQAQRTADWVTIKDDYGAKGKKLTIETKLDSGSTIDLNFYLYPNVSYFLVDMQVEHPVAKAVEIMEPLSADNLDIGAGSDKRIYTTPYTNNFDFGVAPVDQFGMSQNGADRFHGEELKWEEFNGISHCVTAVFDNENKNGLVAGAATVQNWKSSEKLGEAAVKNGSLSSFSIYNWGGSHSGERVSSDKFFVGYYDDYQLGLEEYGQVYNIAEPHLEWNDEVPIGYNTFYSHDNYASAEAMYGMVDYVAEHLKPLGYRYFNLDGGFQPKSGIPFDESMKEFADYVHSKGLKVGGYLTPFTIYEGWLDLPIPGTEYTHRDICLRDENGELIKTYLNTYAIDMTHPAAQAVVKRNVDDYIKWGYDYLKLDFIDMGMYEGKHYDPTVNGMQNYRIGLGIIRDAVLAADHPIYINESIAPLLPAAFAHGRRAACDTSLGVANYSGIERQAFNSAASWWTNGTIYSYNDPDMYIPEYVIQGFWNKYGQNDSKLLATTVALGGGHWLVGDNIPFVAEDRLQIIENKALLDLVKQGNAAKPVKMTNFYHQEEHSPAAIYVTDDDGNRIVGLSNWTDHEQVITVDFADLGLKPNKKYSLTELYSGNSIGRVSESLTYKLQPKGTAIIRVSEDKSNSEIAVPDNLALGKPVQVSSTWADEGYGAVNITDGSLETRWNAADGQLNDQWVEIDFTKETTLNQLVVKEFRDPYFKVANYTLQYWDGIKYQDITKGFMLGDNRVFTFPTITTTKVRLNINTSYGVPSIYEIEAYYNAGQGGNRIDQDSSNTDYSYYSDIRANIERMQVFELKHSDLPKLDIHIYESYRNAIPKDAYYFDLVTLDDNYNPVETIFSASLPPYNIPGSITPYSIYPKLTGLDVNKKYGLILKSPKSEYTESTDNNYGFAYSDNNPYQEGFAQVSLDGGQTWIAEKNRDLLFTVYTAEDWSKK
ncbi:discoidin domain-containing protein [Paenibacillus sp. KQZ6P-2]|uniref:Discoidin domain-containing protein n=1 Tax=Paenibacillus mangrovi TaxID=2931978 RepID=A0A9X1WJC3_9BACL|nr:discoidin domain-containing protein [Paenibacillus mangrovi]MCJ8010432.1 discoidin domain-containing protein [Paenibacillus mangrovi]